LCGGHIDLIRDDQVWATLVEGCQGDRLRSAAFGQGAEQPADRRSRRDEGQVIRAFVHERDEPRPDVLAPDRRSPGRNGETNDRERNAKPYGRTLPAVDAPAHDVLPLKNI